jgi:hypothetical protein
MSRLEIAARVPLMGLSRSGIVVTLTRTAAATAIPTNHGLARESTAPSRESGVAIHHALDGANQDELVALALTSKRGKREQ